MTDRLRLPGWSILVVIERNNTPSRISTAYLRFPPPVLDDARRNIDRAVRLFATGKDLRYPDVSGVRRPWVENSSDLSDLVTLPCCGAGATEWLSVLRSVTPHESPE